MVSTIQKQGNEFYRDSNVSSYTAYADGAIKLVSFGNGVNTGVPSLSFHNRGTNGIAIYLDRISGKLKAINNTGTTFTIQMTTDT